MTPLKCSIASINLPSKKAPDGRYYVQHNGIIRETTIYNKVAARAGYSPIMVKAVCAALFDQIAEELQSGRRIELPDMSAYLTVTGKKVMATRNRAGTEPEPTVHLMPKGELRDCCKGNLSVEIVTRQAAVVIQHFTGGGTNQDPIDGAVRAGTDVRVLFTGTGLYMPDPDDDTVGVWIEDAKGKVIARSKVLDSSPIHLEVMFSRIDLPPGPGYYMCVASRNGLPGVYSVKTVRRRLTIIANPAASAES